MLQPSRGQTAQMLSVAYIETLASVPELLSRPESTALDSAVVVAEVAIAAHAAGRISHHSPPKLRQVAIEGQA
jgi:hypothetical protein